MREGKVPHLVRVVQQHLCDVMGRGAAVGAHPPGRAPPHRCLALPMGLQRVPEPGAHAAAPAVAHHGRTGRSHNACSPTRNASTHLRSARRDLLCSAGVVGEQRGPRAGRVVEAADRQLRGERLLDQLLQAPLGQQQVGGDDGLGEAGWREGAGWLCGWRAEGAVHRDAARPPAHLQPAQHGVARRGQRRRAARCRVAALAVLAVAIGGRGGQQLVSAGAAAHEAGSQLVQPLVIDSQRRQLLAQASQRRARLAAPQSLQESLLQDDEAGLLQRRGGRSAKADAAR